MNNYKMVKFGKTYYIKERRYRFFWKTIYKTRHRTIARIKLSEKLGGFADW